MSDHPDLTSASPAASLIVFRKGPTGPQFLMTRRSERLAFGGGAIVFPGGRVDEADFDLARSLPGDADWAAAIVACVRETLEETGLLVGASAPVDAAMARAGRLALAEGASLGAVLSEIGVSLDPTRFVPFARWAPRARIKRRYDTRFLITDIGTGDVAIGADGSEATELFWATAKELLEMARNGEIGLMFPTRANLLRLAAFDSFEAVRADSLSREIKVVGVTVEERDGQPWLTVPDGYGYDGLAEPLSAAYRPGSEP